MLYASTEQFAIYHGDNRQILPTLAENSVDAIVTDPPYELGFMGKSWDASGVAFDPATWREVLRVLKPGGHLIAFSGSRTYHRMAVAIEDAGFEIRDQIMWIYGSGFPKSHDVSKAIDKQAGAEREVLGRNPNSRENATKDNTLYESGTVGKTDYITKATTDEAKQWEGWGTALKPAHEPMVLARKPLVGTVAANVLTYGTGGLNIDGARVAGAPPSVPQPALRPNGNDSGHALGTGEGRNGEMSQATGRWPANVIHDGSDEVVGLFPDTKSGSVKPYVRDKIGLNVDFLLGSDVVEKSFDYADSGSAARFFYCAKASKRDRNEGLDSSFIAKKSDLRDAVAAGIWEQMNAPHQNHHPTVKPTDLMRYLCRLITPPNGTVLDPFMGSGSTGKAAIYEGFKFIGIEMTDEYLPIAKARIEFAVNDNEGFLL